MAAKPKLILRADGNKEMGLGHVFRVIAMASYLKEHFDCTLFIQAPITQLQQTLQSAELAFVSLPARPLDDKMLAEELTPYLTPQTILVLDGYHFDDNYQRVIKQRIGCKILSIDDIYAKPFLSDAIINHCGGIPESKYSILPETHLYLGPSYAILRPEFQAEANYQRSIPFKKNVFISMGGADPNNNTKIAMATIASHCGEFGKVTVVLGGAYAYLEDLKASFRQYGNLQFSSNLSPQEMIEVMKSSDIAICSASTVSYEYCNIGGNLYIIQTADNQSDMYKFLIESGMARPITDFKIDETETEIHNMRQAQQKYFDGLSGKRINKILLGLYLKDNVFCEIAGAKDVDLYFYWANDQDTRNNSFNTSPIPYENHCAWFHTKLNDPTAKLYKFVTAEGIPLGNIRFQIEGETGTLSYSVDPRYRGQGLAKVILRMASARFLEENPEVQVIEGMVKSRNIPSINAFHAAGYKEVENTQSSLENTLKFQLNRDSFV